MFRFCIILTIYLSASILVSCDRESRGSQAIDTVRDDVSSEPNVEQPKLWLETSDEAGLNKVAVRYARPQGFVGPRVVELSVVYTGNLTFQKHAIGKGLSEARKQLIVQHQSESRLRVIAFAADNLNEIESGVLVELYFQKQQGGSATVEIDLSKPIFAPDEANFGLTVDNKVAF